MLTKVWDLTLWRCKTKQRLGLYLLEKHSAYWINVRLIWHMLITWIKNSIHKKW